MREGRDSRAGAARAGDGVTPELRAVLVDDEQLARDEMGYLLGQLGGIEVIGQAGNGVEALTTIDRLHPDVVFLDVQMPGLTGFEVARRLLDTRAASHIIFVTAYDQHAIEAFEVNAVDYLLKPVDQARLELAVGRARRRVASDRPLDDQLEKIVQLVTDRQNRRERLAIKVGDRFLLVQAELHPPDERPEIDGNSGESHADAPPARVPEAVNADLTFMLATESSEAAAVTAAPSVVPAPPTPDLRLTSPGIRLAQVKAELV